MKDYTNRINKVQKKNQEIFGRIDYDGTYVRLMDSGFFTVGSESPMVSVRKSIFEEAIKYISIENAKQ